LDAVAEWVRCRWLRTCFSNNQAGIFSTETGYLLIPAFFSVVKNGVRCLVFYIPLQGGGSEVMGPSGAGKSLLLHSLCGLAPSNATVPGAQLVGWSSPCTAKKYRSRTGQSVNKVLYNILNKLHMEWIKRKGLSGFQESSLHYYVI